VASAWEEGCPVAGSTPEKQTADAAVCLRRLRSLARRGVDSDDRPKVVRDLALGMVAADEQDLRSIGPLIRDYEWLAERVLDAIELNGPEGRRA
jgi:hypothetical protein